MTDDMMTLRTLLEKSSDADLLREMIGFTAQRLMALEMEGLTGAGHDERSPEVRREDMKKLLIATRGKVFTLQNMDRIVECTSAQGFVTRAV